MRKNGRSERGSLCACVRGILGPNPDCPGVTQTRKVVANPVPLWRTGNSFSFIRAMTPSAGLRLDMARIPPLRSAIRATPMSLAPLLWPCERPPLVCAPSPPKDIKMRHRAAKKVRRLARAKCEHSPRSPHSQRIRDDLPMAESLPCRRRLFEEEKAAQCVDSA